MNNNSDVARKSFRGGGEIFQEFLNLKFSIQLKFSHLPLLEKIVYFFIARMEAGVGIVFETEPYISIFPYILLQKNHF